VTDRHDLDATRPWVREGTAHLLAALTAQQWQASVRSALGRAIPAAELPWMRIREVWLHAVDLGTTAAMSDLPAGVLDLLLDDVTAALSGKDGCPALVLDATDRDRAWTLGAADPTGTVRGPASDQAGWLTGRQPAAERPALPRWL
jgi:maleylpyruvate isomerase